MHLAETTWIDADQVNPDVALLPVGSTEQHGPHAPLGTDTLAAEAVASAGAEHFEGRAIVAPAIPVGVSAEHRDFAGTLWVSPDTFRAYVRETITSLASHGWERVIAVNGHGGNVGPLREVCAMLTRQEIAYTVPFTWFEAVEDPEMGHAGPAETSLLLSTHPDLVETDRLAAAAEGAAARWGEWEGGVNVAYDAVEFTDNGVVGDPRAASAETGDRLLRAAGGALASLSGVVAEREWKEESATHE